MKRKWKEILSINSNLMPTNLSDRPLLTFSDQDLLDDSPNKYIPLIISAMKVNVHVLRMLVDQGISADIMFEDLLPKVKIFETDLTPYKGTDLSGFNGEKTTPHGYLELKVMYRDEKLSRTAKTQFLVLPCKSLYNCIIWRLTLGRLGADASTVHLQMKFYSTDDEIIRSLPTLKLRRNVTTSR